VNWRIPPVGWCVTCLVAFDEERPAAVLWKGNSLCAEHLNAVMADDLAQVILGARAEAEAEAKDGGEG